MPQVFVSHSARDREFVEREIIAPLRQNGVVTWYSEDNIATAAEWEERIRQGLKGCEWFLVAVSMNAVKSEWVQVEVDWAVDNRPGKLIPVMIETCDIDDLHLKLRRLQYIDFRKDIPRAQDKLLAIWGLGKAKQVELRYQKALKMIGAEDWCDAVELLEEVMELDPAHTRAPGDLNWAREKQLLAEQYQKSITDIGAGRWDEAIKKLQGVRKVDVGYKDVDQLMRQAQQGLRKAREEREAKLKSSPEPKAPPPELSRPDPKVELYDTALQAMNREDWTTAREQLTKARALDPQNEKIESLWAALERRERWSQIYARAKDLVERQQWVPALKAFHQLQGDAGNYKDSAEFINRIENKLLEDRPPKTPWWKPEPGYEPGKWTIAIGLIAAAAVGVLLLTIVVRFANSSASNRVVSFADPPATNSARKTDGAAGKWQTPTLPAPSFSGQTLHPSNGGSNFPRLVLSSENDAVAGEDKWFERNGVEWPIYQLRGQPSSLNPYAPALPGFVPAEYEGAQVIKAIRQGDRIFLFYGPNSAEGRYLVALDQAGKFLYGFDLASFAHPPGAPTGPYQGIWWAIEDGEALFVLNAHMGYARNTGGMNAYITAMDLKSKDVIWRSQPLVANSRNFQVIGDAIVCGYGFAEEADYLYILDKRTGEVHERRPLPSGPQFIVRKDNALLVRTSNKDITFKMAF
jgi:hypothetical protein